MKIYFFLLLLIAGTLCFSVISAINNIGIIIFGIFWIAEGRWNEKWLAIKQNRMVKLSIGFFLIHLIGLLNTENLTQGLGVIIDYLPFCLFPLVLSTIEPFSQKQVFTIISVFVLSCFLATAICLSNSIQIAFSDERFLYSNGEYFFYSLFTRPLSINPIYLSLYVGFCIFFLGAFLLEYSDKVNRVEKAILGLATCYFVVILCLLATRTALVSTFVLCLINYIYYVYKTRKKFVYLIPAFTFILGAVLIVSTSDFLRKRFVDIKNLSNKGIEENLATRQPLQKSWKGASVRLAIWKASLEVIENNFFTGVGTGDTQDELVKAYKSNSFIFSKGEIKHNAHNQFIQTQVATGILGLGLLVAIFVVCFYKGWQERSYFYMTFIIYFILNCQTEAMLQRPKGIVFFSMIGCILFFSFNYKTVFQQKQEASLQYV